MKRAQTMPRVATALLLLCQVASGFHARLPIQVRIAEFVLRSTTPGDFDGTIGDAGASAEGRALAKEFYEQVRLREEEKNQRRQDGMTLSQEEARYRNRGPLFNRREVRMGKDVMPSSAGFFSGEGDSVYSFPAGVPQRASASPSGQLVEHDFEFRLLGNNSTEQTLAVQACVAILLLSLYVAMGMSGAMTFGEDLIEWNFPGDAGPPIVELRNIEETASVSSDASVFL